MLFHAMEESLEDEDNIPNIRSLDNPDAIPDLSTLLYNNLLNHDIPNIANDVVSKWGSDMMKRCNNCLNAWRRNWDARRVHDVHGEQNTAFGHPVNFWLLAKLFVVLHFFRNKVSSTPATHLRQDSEFLNFSCANDGTRSGKIQMQMQVLDWLSRIRHRKTTLLPSESFLALVIDDSM